MELQDKLFLLAEARRHGDHLFQIVRPDSLYERPIPERHRLVFYLGHLDSFDWNILARYALGATPFHSTFDELFRRGIDPAIGGASEDRPTDWPSLDEIREYNRKARETIDRSLHEVPDELFHTAVEHRLMHVETLAYLLHQLPDHQKIAQTQAHPLAANGWHPRMVEIPAGTATLGLARGEGFGWDNEFESHTVEVPAFAISKYKVTNGEFLEFVKTGAKMPHFWLQQGDGWYLKTMFGEDPLPLDWPAWVTHQEAEAFARWKGMSLPTEAQFHRAAYGTPTGEERAFPWGDAPPSKEHGNFDYQRWDPAPVTSYPAGDSAFGVAQMLGNGWEWTSTNFHPFAGFEPAPHYPEYSEEFFDDDHFVLKGASPRTAPALLRRSFRNWFRKDYPYVFAGFRLVENQ